MECEFCGKVKEYGWLVQKDHPVYCSCHLYSHKYSGIYIATIHIDEHHFFEYRATGKTIVECKVDPALGWCDGFKEFHTAFPSAVEAREMFLSLAGG